MVFIEHRHTTSLANLTVTLHCDLSTGLADPSHTCGNSQRNFRTFEENNKRQAQCFLAVRVARASDRRKSRLPIFLCPRENGNGRCLLARATTTILYTILVVCDDLIKNCAMRPKVGGEIRARAPASNCRGRRLARELFSFFSGERSN